MRKLLLLVIILPFSVLAQRELKYTKPNTAFQTPKIMVLNQNSNVIEADIQNFLKTHLNLKVNESFKEFKRIEHDNSTTIKYNHFVDGVPVFGDVYIAHLKDGVVQMFNGQYNPNISSKSANISKESAISSALNYFGASVYSWQEPFEEELVKKIKNDPNASYYPQPELSHLWLNGESRLVYKMDIRSVKPHRGEQVFVDAISSNIVQTLPLFHDIEKEAVGISRFSDTVNISTNEVAPGVFTLLDYTRGNGVETWDLNESTDYATAVEFMHGDTIWDIANSDDDDVAIDAHWGAQMTYDYFMNKHGRDSYNGTGGTLLSFVHYDQNWSNAMWSGDRMSYGDGSTGGNPYLGIDIVGHEISHGVTQFAAGLIYQGESGALNESFSDIFGNVIEHYADSNRASWYVGEQCFNTLRNMADPIEYSNPDTYEGFGWTDPNSAFDNGGVHDNSGVQNFWFYLLVEGGSGVNDHGDSYNVTPMGWDAASEIAYKNLEEFLTPGSRFIDARDYSLLVAESIYGSCSPEVLNVAEAWYAVGVGSRLDDNIDPNFTQGYTFACNFPIAIDFTNLTPQDADFYWSFGDGSPTIASENVTHVYSNEGEYTVTLSADLNNECFTNSADYSQTITILDLGSPDSISCNSGVQISTSSIGIDKVEVNTLSYQSGLDDADYNDYTCESNTTLHVDSTYIMTVNTNQTTKENVRAWIDFNNNSEFEDNELIVSSNAKYNFHADTFNFDGITPVLNTPLRMRVISDIFSSIDIQPCSDIKYGQTEDYSIVMVEGNGTIDTSTVDTIDTVKTINPHLEQLIKVYPNPVLNELTVKASKDVVITKVDVINILGNTVMSSPSTQIDVSGLADGVYTIKVTSMSGEVHYERVIKD